MFRPSIEEGGRKTFYGAILSILIYIFAVSLPAFFGIEQTYFTGVLRFLVFPLILITLATSDFPKPRNILKTSLLCLPLLLVCLGNLDSLPFASSRGETNLGDLDLKVFFTLMTAVAEEVVFRFAMMEALSKTNLKKFDILISAALFGIVHIFAIFGGSPILPSLAQAGYTFALGLLLGVAYRYGGLFVCILIHFAFNFLQSDLFGALGGGEWNIPFFAFNIGFYALCFAYALFIFLRFIVREDRSAKE